MTSIYTDRDNLRWKDDESLMGIIFQYSLEVMDYDITVEGENAPSNVSETVYSNGMDVTASVMPVTSVSVIGQVISLSLIRSLQNRSDYSVIITATIGGAVQSRELIIQCPDRYIGSMSEFPYTNRRALIWRLEQPEIGAIFQFPSETVAYKITVEETITPQTVTVRVYKDGSQVLVSGPALPEDNVMPSGAHTISGQVITLMPLTNLRAGSIYSIMVRALILNDFRESKLTVKCVDPKAT